MNHARYTVTILATLALLAGACLDVDTGDAEMASTAADTPAALLPEQRYLMNDKSNRCAGIGGGSTTIARAIQWECNRALDQVWILFPQDHGELEIVNANSGYCLAVGQASPSAGAAVIQFACNDRGEQRWRRRAVGHLTVFQNVNSGHCLSVDRGLTTNGAGLIQWHCRDFYRAEEKWLEVPVP